MEPSTVDVKVKKDIVIRSPAGDASTLDLKVPPYSLEAERAVLGCAMIEKEALEQAIEMLFPGSFYDDKNSKIFGVIKDMHSANAVVDILTLNDELKKRGWLESCGGADYLTELISEVPNAAHIEAYVRIVQEKDILRNLINAASHVVHDCYKQLDEPASLLDNAERVIYQITDRLNTKKGLLPLSSMLGETIEQLETLHQKKAVVTGVPTGFTKFDEMTSGFQPGNLVILAARPGMGKTAMALDIALHAGVKKRIPTVIYSLEMSQQEIVMRLLSALAMVPLQKLRTGFFRKEDWPVLTRKAETLSESPIYLDHSSSGVSIMTLRATARRLASQLRAKGTPLGLIVIDYLQLMQGSRRTPESRQTEIAEISRSLKGLALDLKVPIVALSQLNRSPEEHGRDGKPQLSHLRECVTGETLVSLADGRRAPIESLVGQTLEVWAVDANGKILAARSDRVWPVGKKPVFKVRLASGRSVKVTKDHRLFTLDGWIKAGALKPADRLAIPRQIPEPDRPLEWPDHEVALLGQLIGDGSYLSHQPLRYATASDENSEWVRRSAERWPGVTVKRYKGRGRWHQLLISGNGNRWHPRGVGAWLKELGIFGQRSHEKRIPQSAFRLSNRQVGLLLRHLWATDGTITPRRTGRGSHSVSFSTNSPCLADDVAALLLRLGIVARIMRVSQGKYRPLFVVQVSGATDQKRFLDTVGAFGPRVKPAEQLKEILKAVKTNTNVDTLPPSIFRHIKLRMKELGISHRAMASLRGTSYGGSSQYRFSPSRATVLDYATLLNDPKLMLHTESDLFWDEIVSIEPAGSEMVYDLTVPGPSCWIANGVVSHNSGAIEQDADLVGFIYREGMYKKDPDPETQRKAKLLIAKQRNGPLGEVDLIFIGECARFQNLDPDAE